MNLKKTIGMVLVALGVVFAGLKLAKVYNPTPLLEKGAAKAGANVAAWVKKTGPDYVTYLTFVGVPIVIGGLLLASAGQKESKPTSEPSGGTDTAVWKSQRAEKKAVVHACNVLQADIEPRQLWQFDARNGGFALNRQQTARPGEAFPNRLIAKDWRTLFQRKLNVAWLPSEHVFLRVGQFPLSDFRETLAMVELQLEKLSPLPVAQIVWSIDVMPHPSGNMQSVIVLIVARSIVEEFLGKLEGQGYLADALELPAVDQIRATKVAEDGVWIYPEAVGGKNAGLAAWWYGGVLQNLDLVTLTGSDKAGGVKEQLTQMAWAGELEGWLTAPPKVHLVGSGETTQQWQSFLQGSFDQEVQVADAIPPVRLAAATAKRAAQSDDSANLLPAEFTTRYQQQFYDRLWMRGLFAVAALWVAIVVVYMVFLTYRNFQASSIERSMAGYKTEYTNTMQLKAQFEVLKDRQELKFAALDALRAVSELLPASATLESFTFSEGKRLTLTGMVPKESQRDMIDFDAALRKYKIRKDNEEESLFEPLSGDNVSFQLQGVNYMWRLSVDLKRGETR